MKERSIYVSSADRIKVGTSESHDFKIKLQSILNLDTNMNHELAVDRVMMTYSWYNTSENHNNNKIKYSHDDGKTWNTVTYVNGMYSYSDLNDYLHQYMDSKKHKNGDKYDINILFILSSFTVVVEISNNYK